MKQLLHSQNESIKQIQDNIKNVAKDGKETKSKVEYYIRRIKRLETLWIGHEATHMEASPDESLLYFKENLFDSAQNFDQKNRRELQGGLVKIISSPVKDNNLKTDEQNGAKSDEILHQTLFESEATSENNTILKTNKRWLHSDLCEMLKIVSYLDGIERHVIGQAQNDALQQGFRKKYYDMQSDENICSKELIELPKIKLNICQKFQANEVAERSKFVKSENCLGNDKLSECKSKLTSKTCSKSYAKTNANQAIWKTFQKEYLNQLQRMSKWFVRSEKPKINDVIVVKEANMPPCKWSITKILPLPIETSCKVKNYVRSHQTSIRHSKHKLNVLPAIIAMLVTFAITASTFPANTTAPFTIQKIDSPPGLYFEPIASIRFAYTNWNAIVFVDLHGFLNDARVLKGNFEEMTHLCYTKLINDTSCKTLIHVIDHRFQNINDKNALLLSFNQHRTKRAAFDIVGNIAGDLFGVLDSSFAREYVKDINKLLSNDAHLMKLLKNHTSIFDATINVMKRDESAIETQATSISVLSKQIIDTNDKRNAGFYFQSMTSYIMHLLTQFEHQQDALLDILTGARQSHINSNLLTPTQVKKQLKIIEQYINTDLHAPDSTEFYRIVSIVPYSYNSILFFKISIPLINNEKFHMYQIYAVPFMRNNMTYKIDNEYELMIASVSRQKYQLIKTKQWLKCTFLTPSSAICSSPRKWLISQVSTCIWNLFNQISEHGCALAQAISQDFWIELDETNKWLFYLQTSTKVMTVCNEQVEHFTLIGTGTLQLKQNCILRSSDTELIAKTDLDNEINEFILPNFQINTTKPARFVAQNAFKPATFLKSNLFPLQTKLNNVKQQSVFTDQITIHDFHQYGISHATLSFGIVLLILYYYYYMG